jgi:hypothetical protein
MAYCAKYDLDTSTNNTKSAIAEATLIKDDEDEVQKSRYPIPWIPAVEKTKVPFSLSTPQLGSQENDQCHVIPSDDDDTKGELNADRLLLLKYHNQFGHVSFQRLVELAKQGVIPKRLAKVPPPMCAACAYAKATRKPWKGKDRIDYEGIKYTRPGEMVSVDQLVSPTVGFIAQMTGKLTNSRYRYATVYVDHASHMGYVYLKKSADADETVKGKAAFEAYAAARGVTIRAYHADNGIF